MLFNFASEKLILSTFLRIIFILLETRAIQKGTMTRSGYFGVIPQVTPDHSISWHVIVLNDRVYRRSWIVQILRHELDFSMIQAACPICSRQIAADRFAIPLTFNPPTRRYRVDR